MFDSISDSEQSKSRTCQESEFEQQLLAESHRIQLQEQVEQLRKENTNLQAQYEQAILISSQVEELHQKNRQLASDLRNTVSENENLAKRLEISQKMNQDLKQKLESEKQQAAMLHKEDLLASQKELQKAKAQAKAQLDSVLEQLEEVRNAKDQNDMTIKVANNKVERILENAARYFEVEFSNAESFISFLGQNPAAKAPPQCQCSQQAPPPPPPAPCAQIESQIQASLERKLRHEKARTKSLANAKDELEKNVQKLQRQIQEMKLENQKEINNLISKQKQMEEDRALADAEKKHVIDKLQSKINVLTQKLNARKQEAVANAVNQAANQVIQKASIPIPTQQPVYQPDTQHYVSKEECDHIINQNSELQARVNTLTKKCDDLQNQLRVSDRKYHDADLELSRTRNDLASIKTVHNDTLSELDMLRKALHEKENARDHTDKKFIRREFQAQKALCQNLQNQVNSQKEQLSELSLANQQAQHTIDTQHTQISDLKHDLQLSHEENQKIREDLISLQAELESRVELTPEELIPATAWTCSEFTSELNASINLIARNPSLQIPSKIQNIYKIIAKYYNEIIAARDATISSHFNENQKTNYAVNQFLVNLSIVLELEPITFNDFIAKNSEQKFIDTIKEIRSCHSDFKRRNESLTQAIDLIDRAFCINTLLTDGTCNICELDSQINCLKLQQCKTNEQLTKRNKKYKEVSNALKATKKKAAKDAEDNKVLVRRLNGQIDDLTKQNDELVSSVQRLKWEIQNTKAKLQDQLQAAEEAQEEFKEKIEALEKAAEKARADAEMTLNAQNQTQSQNNETVAHYAEQINQLKRLLDQQKDALREKENEISRLSTKRDAMANDSVDRLNAERQQIISGYESAVQELRSQCDTNRQEVDKLSKILGSTEKKLKQAKEQILQLKKEKLKFENDFKNQQEQNERQLKLTETQSRVAILNAQTEYTNKLDEEKAKIEDERRRMYSTIAESFKQFTSPHENLNEKSFKTTVFKARDEISRLTAMDAAVRRIVNAERYQKTDDAVAQAVLRIA